MSEQDEQGANGNGDGAANPPDLAGYPSVEALVQAYRSSGSEAKRLAAERDQYARALNELQRPPIPQRPRPEEYLSTVGIDPMPLMELIDQRAEQKMQEAIGPLVRGVQARSQVISRVPDYAKHEAEIGQWLQEDAERSREYAEAFSKSPALAMEWAALRYRSEKRAQTRSAREEQAEDAAHGQIPTARQGDTRRAPAEGYEAAVNKARERMQQTGSRQDVEQYARLRLHKVISEEHLNQ